MMIKIWLARHTLRINGHVTKGAHNPGIQDTLVISFAAFAPSRLCVKKTLITGTGLLRSRGCFARVCDVEHRWNLAF
jgi:hypothetical protein